MRSRKSSAVSIASLGHRKFSTTRLQRQAELSLLNEETHLPGLAFVTQGSGADSFENFSFQARSPTALSIARTETGGPPPFDAHPGSRLRGFSRASFSWAPAVVRGSFVKPFDEPPEGSQARYADKRYPAVKRTFTGPIDIEHAREQIQQSAIEARDRNVQLRRLYNKARGRRAVKPGGLRGLQLASSLPTAHANSLLLHQATKGYDRQALCVFDFDTDSGTSILRGPPAAFETIAGLRKYLNESDTPSAIRIIYACNQKEAINYLDDAFAISHFTGPEVTRGFHDWMQNHRLSRGASNKIIRWRPSYDSARGLICAGFGIDFGSTLLTRKSPFQTRRVDTNQTTPDLISSNYSHRQRLSVYMQRQSRDPKPAQIMPEFNTAPLRLPKHTYGNIMVISEYSSEEVGEIISTNALMTVTPPTHGVSSTLDETSMIDDQAAISTIQSNVINIFSQICQIWRSQILLIHEEHADLEDDIYEQPADVRRAGNVWAMSQHLHNMLKLMNRHAKIVQALQEDFQLFVGGEEEQDWLDQSIDEFGQLSHDLVTDYLEPLEHMIDLMYKSVTIRDSKQSLELAASLWRLSWITFIFLPLTFLAGIFGMNVASLQHYPSIKWYFITAAPLMLLVFASWSGLRRLLPYTLRSKSIADSDIQLHHLRRVGENS